MKSIKFKWWQCQYSQQYCQKLVKLMAFSFLNGLYAIQIKDNNTLTNYFFWTQCILFGLAQLIKRRNIGLIFQVIWLLNKKITIHLLFYHIKVYLNGTFHMNEIFKMKSSFWNSHNTQEFPFCFCVNAILNLNCIICLYFFFLLSEKWI